MKIRVRKKEKQYAQVHKNLLFHKKLSVQSKGIGSILECYSDNFEITFESLKIHTKLQDKTLRKYIKELENNLFLFRIQIIKNCNLIWFFDSENLDIKYVLDEIEKVQNCDKIRFITAYQILVGENMACHKLTTYNNILTYNNTTIKPSTSFSNTEALNIMYQVKKSKERLKIKNRSYLQTPKEKNKGVYYE